MSRLLATRRAEIASDPELSAPQKDERVEMTDIDGTRITSFGNADSRRSDILSRLVLASEREGNKGLRDEELVRFSHILE